MPRRGRRSKVYVTLFTGVVGCATVLSACTSGGRQANSAEKSNAPIKIGVIEPLTKSQSLEGHQNLKGMKLYFKSIGNRINGHPIELVVKDGQADPKVALQQARALVQKDDVDLLAGISSTAVCNAVASLAKQTETPLVVTTNCGSETLAFDPATASNYVIRTTQVTSALSQTMARYLTEHGFKTAVTVGADYAGGTETIGLFDAAYIKHGGKVVQEFWPPMGTVNYSPYLSKLDRNASVVVTFLPGGLHFFTQYKRFGLNIQVADTFGLLVNPQNLKQLRGKAVGVIANSFWTPDIDTQQNRSFKKAYTKAYGTNPPVSSESAHGYNGAEFIAQALKKVGGDASDSPALLKALSETRIVGPGGPVALDKRGDVIRNYYVYKVTSPDGKKKNLAAYKHVGLTWEAGLEQIKNFPYGDVKGRFVNVSKAELPRILSGS